MGPAGDVARDRRSVRQLWVASLDEMAVRRAVDPIEVLDVRIGRVAQREGRAHRRNRMGSR
jgi:hypothetical protein